MGLKAVSTSGSTGALTPTQIAAQQNSLALLLPKYRAKKGNVNAGNTNLRMLGIGDSILSGAYSSNSTGASADWRQKCWANQLAQMLTNTGIYAFSDSFMGFKDVAHDARVVFGSPWTTVAEVPGGTTIGGTIATSASNTTGFLTYTPTSPVDTFKVWYAINTGAGVLGYNVNGAGAATINQNGAIGFSSFTTTAALGINTLKLNWASGGNVYVCGIEAWNSTISSMQIINAGWDGATTAQWVDATSPYSPANFATMNCDFTGIALGVNDLLPANAISVATFKANQQTLITSALTTGDVLLITENPVVVASTISLANQQLYWNAVKDLATSNNLALVDIFGRWVSYEYSSPLGYYNPSAYPANVHPSGLGHSDYAQAIFNVIGNP